MLNTMHDEKQAVLRINSRVENSEREAGKACQIREPEIGAVCADLLNQARTRQWERGAGMTPKICYVNERPGLTTSKIPSFHYIHQPIGHLKPDSSPEVFHVDV